MPTPRTAESRSSGTTRRAGGAVAGPGYRYRGASKSVRPVSRAEKVRELLKQQRQALSFKSSSLRDVSVRMNERIAQAIVDGMKATDLAAVTQLSRTEVRRIGLSFADLVRTGTTEREHLEAIRKLRRERQDIEKARCMLEEKRLHIIAEARKTQLIDDYELASLTGFNPAYLGKMTWGVCPKTPLQS